MAGGAAAFEPFVRSYLQTFSCQPVTSEAFRAFYCHHFQHVPGVAGVDWDGWLYKPGGRPTWIVAGTWAVPQASRRRSCRAVSRAGLA